MLWNEIEMKLPKEEYQEKYTINPIALKWSKDLNFSGVIF